MREALIRLLTSTSSRHRPWQISAAVAIGVLGGVLPKTSLLFYVLLAAVVCLPVHLPLALLTMLAVSPVAGLFQPQIGQVGLYALMHSSWSQFWLRLDAYPLIPWLSLHNTLVNGSSLIGMALMLPAYAATRLGMGWLLAAVPGEAPEEIFAELRAEIPGRVSGRVSGRVPARVIVNSGRGVEAVAEAVPRAAGHAPVTTLSQIERILASYDALDDNVSGGAMLDAVPVASAADADQVIRRAALMVSAVDDILSVLDSEERAAAVPAVHTAPFVDAETSITIVRGDQASGMHNRHLADGVGTRGEQPRPSFDSGSATGSATGVRPGSTGGMTTGMRPGLDYGHDLGHPSAISGGSELKPGNLTNHHVSHIEVVPKPMLGTGEERRTNMREVREGEVLRNLLNHLRELKEKV